MLISTKTPLRISFVGGGTDLPKYYKKYGGEVIASTINKYIYFFLNKNNKRNILLKYSKTENVIKKNDIKHKIAKAILQRYNQSGLEIVSISDIPARTGLGSSSAYTVGFLKLMELLNKKKKSKYDLFKISSKIEIKNFGERVGKQEHYISIYGGFRHIKFLRSGQIVSKKIEMKKNFSSKLEKHMCLIFTGVKRKPNFKFYNKILKKNDQNQYLIKKIINAIKAENIIDFGKVINETWELKKSNLKKISNLILKTEKILKTFDIYGLKLLGSGGGGYFLVVGSVDILKKLEKKFKEKYIKIKFELSGSKQIKF